MFICHPAIADDLADLKAAHQMFDKAWNTADVNGAFEYWQDGGIWLPDNQAFPIVTNSALGIAMFTKWLETHIFQYSWYKVDYRVVGNTGFVWGVRTRNVIVKATGTGKRTFVKTSLVFMKSKGKTCSQLITFILPFLVFQKIFLPVYSPTLICPLINLPLNPAHYQRPALLDSMPF